MPAWLPAGNPEKLIYIANIAWIQAGPPDPRIKLVTGEEIPISAEQGAAILQAIPLVPERTRN